MAGLLLRALAAQECQSSSIRISQALADRSSAPDSLWARDTLTTKSLESFLKLVGKHYLTQTLKPKLMEVFLGNRPCEVRDQV